MNLAQPAMHTKSSTVSGNALLWKVRRMLQGYLVASGLFLLALSAHSTEPDLQQLRTLIAEQYDAVDTTMTLQPYRTRALIVRPGEDDIVETTSFHPERPEGTRERLEQVNNASPSRRDQRRFDRRPQPDNREEQRFRLLIDYSTLEIVRVQTDIITLQFQPVLLANGEKDADGRKFAGQLTFDRLTDSVKRVDMALDEPFSKLFFNIEQFTVMETFAPHPEGLLRTSYYHNMDISNRLLDISNEATITFDYDNEVEP